MKAKLLTPILCLFFFSAFAQSYSIKQTLDWNPEAFTYSATGIYSSEIWTFGGAEHDPDHPNIPTFSERFKVPGKGLLTVEVINMTFEQMELKNAEEDQYLTEDIVFETKIEQNRQEYFGTVSFLPIRMSANGQYERLVDVELNVKYTPTANGSNGFAPPPPPPNTYTSVLSDGEVFKFAVDQDGIYKLDLSFLKDKLGIDNIESIDPRTIKLYGNGGGSLPTPISTSRYDDLEENAIQVVGEDDGKFDANDFVLFYGEGPDKWSYNANKGLFNQEKNVYDNQNYYFIKISSGNGLRIASQNSIDNTEYNTTSFNDFLHFEEDKANLLYAATGSQGSGSDWYGDVFNPTREQTYDEFTLPNIINSEEANIAVAFAGRSPISSSFSIEVNGQSFNSNSIGSISWGNNESTYAKVAVIDQPFNANNDKISVTVKYPGVGDQRNLGWLDYIEINARRTLALVGNQMSFRDIRALEYNSTTFNLSGINANTEIWDISNPLKPSLQETKGGSGTAVFGVNTGGAMKHFIAFNRTDGFLSPTEVGRVDPQNLHAIDKADFLIVYHSSFESMAQQLAEHRKQNNNMEVALAPVHQIYNEFSSGSQDPTAIRDLAKMLYERNPNFRFLLLLGDGSFDHKDVYGFGKNFVPTFQTKETLNPIKAYPYDDFFTLLSDDDGQTLEGDMEVAVGRLPVKDAMEAQAVVNKIIRYDSDPAAMGDWRNRILFTADDEDGGRHLIDADSISRTVSRQHEVFNQDKVYFDAFQQISTAGGTRFPKANEAINRNIFKGVLATNYLGHGGSTGLAQERVLTKDDISSWTNYNNPTLFVTATCSFTGYDEPTITSAGELAILKEDGGAIALFTTVRAVYASQNFRLTKAVFDTLFQLQNNEIPALGEILRIAKNNVNIDTNSRKFTLIGDPSQQLAIPRYGISTSKINDKAIIEGQPDTIRALQKVTIEGFIQNDDGSIMTDFNGKVYPTLYDKAIQVTTLAQDEGSPIKQFSLQKNILFKGVASVVNGAFSFTFVVPKDINYTYGYGKLSFYAEDGVSRDARGFYNKIVIGGTDPNAIIDNEGPLVEVFMDSEDFVFGGITSENPTLLVKLSDDNGINVVGNSIGHDLIGVLDEQTQSTYILNDFYESKLDSFTRGEVRFPLFDLEEGLHRIKVKAWDVSNNSGEGFTEFVVFNSEEAVLDHVLNYPNPFTTSTNFQFEHNLHGQQLDVMIQVFTVAGQLVKTIERNMVALGDRVTDINWDGKDDYGDRLGRGVYVYKVKIRAPGLNEQSLKTESDFEKLVILK